VLSTFSYGQNWVASSPMGAPMVTPNLYQIPSWMIVTISGDVTWYHTLPYSNVNRGGRIVIPIAYALRLSTGIPIAKVNGVPIQGATYSYNNTIGGFICDLPPSYQVPPNTTINFTVSNLTIDDSIDYWNQSASIWIDFIAQPNETSYFDNVASTLFNTVVADNPLPIDSHVVSYPMLSNALSINPNPFVKEINIHYESTKEAILLFEIYTLQGKKVLYKKLVLDKGKHELVLDLHELLQGMYVMHILKNNTLISTNKIIKL
jgi:hypothetical protein